MAVTSMASAPAAARVPRRGRDPDGLWRWLTFAPALLLMLFLSVLPLVNLFATSFFNITWEQGQGIWTFVGPTHYQGLLSDALLHAGLTNTLIFAFLAVTGQMVLGFMLAYLVSRIERGKVLYRAIFILPILIPGIVIGAIWKLMMNYDFGLLNQFIGLFGLGPHDWLGNASTALLSVVIVDIWHWMPFCFLLFLAGLESLPQDVFEAAKTDGATAWQELRYITLPMMLPTIMVTFAFRLILAFKVFDEVYLLTGGGPGTATEVLSFTLYQRYFTEDRMGYGSAIAVMVIFLICLLLVMAAGLRRATEARS
ncbi:multiple sugar transport system permease protein [Devosia enhydra]|uniref:Multiple sugar transport system permease protein n=1 Tax=Devosia enhydra TaxID=665118 RepID=A0A1K2HWV6_9HYPH|nr:sugar ABC transporter permease [Devosia enhydra]SFZ83560.1 multiple sugar transport system permease protein [Devosia enhydra]